MGIQALISEAPIERLNIRIMRGFVWLGKINSTWCSFANLPLQHIQ